MIDPLGIALRVNRDYRPTVECHKLKQKIIERGKRYLRKWTGCHSQSR